MAWYQRSYFNLKEVLKNYKNIQIYYFIYICIFLLIFFYFQNLNIIYCFNSKKAIELFHQPLLTTNYNGWIIKYSPDLYLNQVQSCAAEFKNNKDILTHSVCKFLHTKDNLLYNFNHRSPYSHLHINFEEFVELSVNFQLSHHNYDNSFTKIGDIDLKGRDLPQFISNDLRVYSSFFKKLYQNSDSLYLNKNLEIYDNYKNFIINTDDAEKIKNSKLNYKFKNYLKNY